MTKGKKQSSFSKAENKNKDMEEKKEMEVEGESKCEAKNNTEILYSKENLVQSPILDLSRKMEDINYNDQIHQSGNQTMLITPK